MPGPTHELKGNGENIPWQLLESSERMELGGVYVWIKRNISAEQERGSHTKKWGIYREVATMRSRVTSF